MPTLAEMQKLCGWVPPEDRSVEVQKTVEQFFGELKTVFFTMAAPELRETGKGKIALLHKPLIEVLGHFPVHLQTIGDCVSHGWGLGIDILKAVEIVTGREAEAFMGETATEQIYGDSRVRVGGGRLGNGDGSVGAWAAKSVTSAGGVLLRKKYEGIIDLTTYSGKLAKEWGRIGVPKGLYEFSKKNFVETVSLVNSYNSARDSIASGYPIPVCSMQGFSSKRDEKGFAKPQGEWAHCMVFIGVDDADSRPGLLCMNSWGTNWISGPKRHDQPDGSFWVDADVVDRMLRGDDSFAISGFNGYPAPDSKKKKHFLL